MTVSITNTCLLGCSSGTRPLGLIGLGRQYLRCEECGLAFVSYPTRASSLESQYLEDSSSTVSYYQSTVRADRLTFRRRLRLMAKFDLHRGRLLDVGCSIGTLMSVAKEMDWEVEGLEPNPKAAKLARRRGFTIHEGFFTEEQVSKLPGGYQCVVMSDVIEHVSDPIEALRLARELLEPGGFLLLSTPNLESFWCKKFQLKPAEHLFLFSSKNLRKLLEKLRLKICHLQRTSRRRDLRELNYSTTQLGWGAKIMISNLCRLRLEGVAAWLMDHFFRDELFVIARKSRRVDS